MTAAFPVLVFVLGAAIVFAARHGILWTSAVAWLALGGGFSFLMWGDANLAAAVSIAAIAGFVTTPTIDDSALRFRTTLFTAVVPVTMAVGALACVREAASVWTGNVVLYAASWAAILAALSAFTAAIAARRAVPAALPATIAATAGAILIAGTGRSSLPEAFYGFSLRTGEEPLLWVLAPVQGFESGIRLSVAVPVPVLETALIVLVAAGLVATAALLAKRTRFVAGMLGAIALGAIGFVSVGLSALVSGLSMPSSEPYSAEVKRRLLARGGGQVTDTGAFNSVGDITVAMADLAPEILGLTMVGILAALGIVGLRSADAEPETPLNRAVTHELMVRGVAFLWVGWFVLLIIHNDLLGAPGMGSPGEWVFTGVCIAATGVVLMCWRTPTTKLGEVLDELAPAFLAGSVILCAGLAARFGALPGLSLGVFE